MTRPESCHDCPHFAPYVQFDGYDRGQDCEKARRSISDEEADANRVPEWCPLPESK